MISPILPPELKAALDAKLQGFSRTDAAQRSQKISNTYRTGGGSGTIKSEADALAYALARMPATYAAVAASLNALTEIVPDFAPETLLDVGAGPGTASWAAAEAFPALQNFTLLDANATLSRLALELARGSSRLAECRYLPGDAGTTLAEVSQADLVVASYIIGELGEKDQRQLVDAMWAKARHALIVIEPGTPAGYARILALRAQLIAAGAHVAAPCPHDRACPLAPPDWERAIRFVELPLARAFVRADFGSKSSGGRKRKAEFGIRSTPFFSPVMREAVAVIPGRSFKSALLTSTTQV